MRFDDMIVRLDTVDDPMLSSRKRITVLHPTDPRRINLAIQLPAYSHHRFTVGELRKALSDLEKHPMCVMVTGTPQEK